MSRVARGLHRPAAHGPRRGLRRGFTLLLVTGLLAAATVLITGSRAPAYASEFYPAPAGGAYTVDGHGFGHGRGMSQYGAQGAALAGLGYEAILAHYYPGTVRTDVGDPGIRVQLTATASGDVRVDPAAGVNMTVVDGAGAAAATVPGAPLRVVTTGSTQILYRHNGTSWVRFSMGAGGAYAGPIRISAPGGLTVYRPGGSSKYRGSISVVRTDADTSVAVNHVNMQGYLYGVVPRESPASWEPAALQAQSVAARSYALRLKQNAKPHWDLCDTTACQVYGGMSSENLSTNDAVNRTGGVALYYNGGPAFTEFSSSNGGHTSAGSVPYLAAFPDPYDSGGGNPNHQWTVSLTTAYLQAEYPQIGTFRGLRVLGRDGRGEWGGRVTSVEVVGSTATVTLGAARFGMKSNWWRPRGPHNPVGSIDSAARVANGQVRFGGWTLDPDTSASLRVHAYVDGRPVAAFSAANSRPDVGNAYEGKGDLHGFDFTLNLGQGRRAVCLYALNQGEGANTSLGCRNFDMGSAPIGDVNSLTLTAGTARLVGWTLDRDTPDPVAVHAYVDGAVVGNTVANLTRNDVGRAYPSAGPDHGFDISVPLTVGRHDVCLYAIDPGPGAGNPKLECFGVTVLTDPVGGLDRLVGGATTVDVAGWAVDTDTPTPIDVEISVDGASVATLPTDRVRADVGARYPGTGTRHGFTGSIPVTPGTHDICVNALNVGSGTVNTRLGCARVSVGVPPVGGINGLTRAAGLQARITGWAIDPDTTDPISVHVYVNGRVAGGLRADVNRPDVEKLYPASGPAHGFDGVFTLRPGSNQVCVYAINVAAGSNRGLGCRLLSLPAAAANPIGAVDPGVAPETLTVTGWAVDPDVPTTPVRVHVYVDGRAARALTASAPRSDVGRAFPFYGPDHGYTASLRVTPGRHTACVYAVNQGQGSGNVLLGCRTVDVPA